MAEAKKQIKRDYTIGGARITLPEDPETLLGRVITRLQQGAGLNDLFVLHWQRTAIHFTHQQQQIDALKREIEALKRRP